MAAATTNSTTRPHTDRHAHAIRRVSRSQSFNAPPGGGTALTRIRPMLVLLLALAGMLLVTGSASAKDRNHDRIPDRWEKRHHLSLHHNQARRDQDRDGLKNRAEFRAGTN